MSKGLVRTCARGLLKVLAASVMVAAQCIVVTPGIRGQAQNPPIVDLPSLAGKSMGDIYQQFKSSKKYCREVTKDLLARMPPDAPSFDDFCQFKNGRGLLNVFTYRGRAAGFTYVFRLNKVSTDPEEALLRVGINVNGVKPRIQEIQPGGLRYYVWSGTFSEKSWKEVKVLQLLNNRNRCDFIIAIPSDKVE
jgi:hypothetical protein